MFFISSVKCHSVKHMCRVGQLTTEPSSSNEDLLQPLKPAARAYPAESDGTHRLHTAAERNDLEVINYFIESGYELDVEDSSGTTPLVSAVVHANYRAAAMLHNARVERFARQLYGRHESLIPWAFTQRAMIRLTADVVAKLRAKGFSARETGDILARVSCCLDEVVRLHEPAMTAAFLESDCSGANYGENQTIFRIVIPRLDVRHLEVLLHRGSDVESRRLEFFRVLMDSIAGLHHESQAGRAFLERLLRWELLGEPTLEYLELALGRASAEGVKAFLQYGYHAAAKARCGRDVLASLYGNPNAKVVLLLKGADVDVGGRGCGGKTPLHFAVERDVPENVRFLLDRAADPNAADEVGSTPLMEAFSRLGRALREGECRCSPSCAQLLLQDRADPLLRDAAGETIFDYGSLAFRKFVPLAKLALSQLAVREALGVGVEHHVAGLLSLHDQRLRRYYEECRQQVRQLMGDQVRDDKLSMFAILAEREEKLARRVGDDELATMASSLKKYKKKMHYYDTLKSRIKRIEELVVCRERAIDLVSECTELYDPHHLFVDNIVGYLSARDLLKFK